MVEFIIPEAVGAVVGIFAAWLTEKLTGWLLRKLA